MTELPTAPESDLVSTFWVKWKRYNKLERSGRINGSPADADDYMDCLAETPGVTDIKIEWER